MIFWFEIQGLASCHDFSCNDTAWILKNLSRFTSCSSSHADEVFLVFTRWDRVNAGWVRQDFVFRCKRSTSILRNHEAWVEARVFDQEGWQFTKLAVDQAFHPTFRYVSDLRKGNTQEVLGDDWVICHRVDFDFNFCFYISNRVFAGSMDLRNTTECIRILYPLLGRNSCVFASFKEVTDITSGCQLSTLRTDSMKVFFKWAGNTIVDFHWKSTGNVRQFEQLDTIISRKSADTG